jgi:hypothetical protein
MKGASASAYRFALFTLSQPAALGRRFCPKQEGSHEDQRPQSAQGTIVEVKKGTTDAHVRIDIGGQIDGGHHQRIGR